MRVVFCFTTRRIKEFGFCLLVGALERMEVLYIPYFMLCSTKVRDVSVSKFTSLTNMTKQWIPLLLQRKQ